MKTIRKFLLLALAALLLATLFVACKEKDEPEAHTVHTFGEWQVTKAATEEAAGERVRTCSVCGATEKETLDRLPHTHTFGAWQIKTEATFDADGLRERTCSSCGATEEEPITALSVAYRITTVANGDRSVVRVKEDGAYALQEPEKAGYRFLGWKNENEEDFPASGTVSENITVHAAYEILPTATFAELKSRVEDGADAIYLTANITLTDTIYVSDDVRIYATGAFTLTRSADFLGDLFVLGRTESNENTIFLGKTAKLTLRPEGEGAITLDGNKSAMTGDVAGTAFFLENSATLNIYDGVSIVNCKKTANAYLLSDDHNISSAALTGGSVAIIANGTCNLYGGVIRDCEVNQKDEKVTDEAEQTENFNASSRGGAIFNYGTVNLYGGSIENCKAARGGAIYNYRVMYLYEGTIANNAASAYGGAVYQPDSQYAYFTSGAAGTEIKVTFSGNTAGLTGGAFFTSHQSTAVVAGGTLFAENKALSGNGGAVSTAGALVVEYAEFTGNTASSKGGAIYAYYNKPDEMTREVQIKNGKFIGNTAPRGAALALGKGDNVETGAIGVIGAVLFKNNNAPANAAGDYGFGGAVHLDNKSTLTVNGGATFEGNTAAATGGAVYITKTSTLTILAGADTTVSFLSNTATSKNGGAIYATDNSVLCSMTTDNGKVIFEGNAAGGNGGAIYLYTNVTAIIGDIILNSNTAAAYGGAMYASGAANAIINHIEATGNTATMGGCIYETTTATEITLNGGDLTGNVATDANGGNAVWVNTKKAILKIKGGTSGEYLTFTDGDILGASGFAVTAID